MPEKFSAIPAGQNSRFSDKYHLHIPLHLHCFPKYFQSKFPPKPPKLFNQITKPDLYDHIIYIKNLKYSIIISPFNIIVK